MPAPTTQFFTGRMPFLLPNRVKALKATRNKHKKLKPGLVTFHDIWPGNGVGLFSKKKISKKIG